MRKLAIIGAGNMAEAIARGVLRGGAYKAGEIVAADVSPQRRDLFARELHIECCATPESAAAQAPVILLCVKPQQMDQVLRAIAPVIRHDALVISIAAGVATDRMDEHLAARRARIVRAMPNTPMLVGEGMVALSLGPRASHADLAIARQIFAPAANVIELPEEQMDAVTALSGSGPAYFYFLIEQIIRAGEELGLAPEHARTLATRTAIGVGKMLTSASESPQELRRRVTSPGGTTEAAIAHMQAHGMDQIIVDAIKAAERRGQELGSR